MAANKREFVEALVFFRSKSAAVQELYRTISSDPRATHVAITTGVYDLVALVHLESRRALDDWVASARAMPGVESVEPQAIEDRWENPRAVEKPVQAWSLIETSTKDVTVRDLKSVESIHEVFATGDTNVLARFSGDSFEEVRRLVLEGLGRTKGVERTSTLLASEKRTKRP